MGEPIGDKTLHLHNFTHGRPTTPLSCLFDALSPYHDLNFAIMAGPKRKVELSFRNLSQILNLFHSKSKKSIIH